MTFSRFQSEASWPDACLVGEMIHQDAKRIVELK